MPTEPDRPAARPPVSSADLTADHLPDTTPPNPVPPDPTGTVAATPADARRSAERSGLHPLVPLAPEFPGYELTGELGRGGMGVVYRAREVALNRVVALKLLPADRADGRTIARFLVEAEAVAAVRHPNVVGVHHYGETGGWPYMVLEFCPGGSLADRLRAGPRPGPREAAGLVEGIARGVAAAHAKGIVHRDLKPGNVLFGEGGEPKVADFGLAKLAAGGDLTLAGDVMGTPAYMAPEQADGRAKGAGPPADVWSLGVILYECLSGFRPFAGDTPTQLFAAARAETPPPLSGRALRVPRDLEYVCLKCLRKEPADRYPTAAELAADLRRFLAGEPIGGRRQEWRYRARRAAARWWPRAAAAVVLLGLLGGVWWSARRDPVPAAEPPREEDPSVRLRREEVGRRVEALLRFNPAPDREPPHPVARLDDLPPVDLSAFHVIYDDRTVDLRGWRPLPAGDPAAECYVLHTTRRVLTKHAPADVYRAEARTSGRDVVMRALAPNPARARAFTFDRPAPVGGQPMKDRQLVFDVADVPVGTDFTVHETLTYWNSLQTVPEQWFGVVGRGGGVRTSMLMLFPADRPFRDYALRVAPIGDKHPVPYTGPVITFQADDRRWLYWEIPSPQPGQVYRVDWTW
jgi:hypothetical protein